LYIFSANNIALCETYYNNHKITKKITYKDSKTRKDKENKTTKARSQHIKNHNHIQPKTKRQEKRENKK